MTFFKTPSETKDSKKISRNIRKTFFAIDILQKDSNKKKSNKLCDAFPSYRYDKNFDQIKLKSF